MALPVANGASYMRYSGWTGSKELIARLVPEKSRVLDVGCSSGVLGRELIDRKGCSLIGIDIDSSAANVAEKYYTRVFVGDIQQLYALPAEYSKTFDVTVFADVLEHTVNPEEVLSHYVAYARSGGIVIISLPNVANWLNRFYLLAGKWDYADFGTLDRTHLKFFTYSTAKKLVGDVGLTIKRVECTSGLHSLDYKTGFSNPARVWKNLLAYQFVFECLVR